jgi:hypothetical protein
MDLRETEWRVAIVKIAEAIKNCPLTNRALAFLICDSTKQISFTQVMEVLEAIPKLPKKYLKKT